MNIGEKLKIRRKKAGLTQEQVAEKLNITRQTLSHWEIGKYYPDIDAIIRLSQIYHLSLDELLLGKIYFKGAPFMSKKISFEQIERLVKTHYPNAIHMKELNGGLVSQTYRFEADGNRYIFQVGNHLKNYQKERYIHQTLSGLLPVRQGGDIHQTAEHVSYAISDYIEGDKLFDLNSQQLLDIVPSVLKTLETLESISIGTNQQGYGYFDQNGTAAFPTWLDYVAAVYNPDIYQWDSLENNGLDEDVVKNAIAELQTHIKTIRFSGKNMIHGDLGSYNLLANHNQISGIIDWSLAMYGDHLYDKANFLFWNENKLQPLIQAITNQYVTDDVIKETVYCYMLRIGLEELYNTVIRKEVGYDIEWVANRLNTIMNNYL